MIVDLKKNQRLIIADLKSQMATLDREVKRVEAVAAELVVQNTVHEDDKIKEYIEKVLRLGKIDFAIRYSSKLLFALTVAKEKARREKEEEF
jgi:hypothetical protein